MALFGKKAEEGTADALETYKVVYRGGLPRLPKAKSGEIRMVLTPTEFQFNPTIGSQKYWEPLHIPYGDVRDLHIVARQESTVEKLLGGPDAHKLDDANNIHIDYVDSAGTAVLLRFEMLTGLTVQGQAKKCREFEDRLHTHGIRSQFQHVPAQGAATGGTGADIADQITKLAALRDQGLLTAEEFEAKKTQLLDRM